MISAQMTDIPVHRTVERAVTGMGLAMGRHIALLDRPYVYRGTGKDQFPETLPVVKPPARRKKYKPKSRTTKRWRPRYLHCYMPMERSYYEPFEIAAGERLAGVYVEPEPGAASLPESEPERPPAPVRHLRPAPDWKPLTGADIEFMLDEVDRAGLRRGVRGG